MFGARPDGAPVPNLAGACKNETSWPEPSQAAGGGFKVSRTLHSGKYKPGLRSGLEFAKRRQLDSAVILAKTDARPVYDYERTGGLASHKRRQPFPLTG